MSLQKIILLNADGLGVTLEPKPGSSALEPTNIPKQIREQLGLEVFLLHDGGRTMGFGQPVMLEVLVDFPQHLGDPKPVEVPRNFRPWQRPGWLARAATWWGKSVGEIGQVSTYDLGCVLKAEGSYFKAGESQEALITQAIVEEHPDLTPTVLAADLEQNWLVTADFGARLSESDDLELWLNAVRRLAGFHQADSRPLLDIGCPVYRFTELPGQFEGFIEDSSALNDYGLSDDQIAKLWDEWPRVSRFLRLIADLALTETPVHGDAQPMNALQGRGGVWFDWSEAAVAHPLTDIGWMLAWLSRRSELAIRKKCPDIHERLWAEYLQTAGLPEANHMTQAMVAAMAHRALVYHRKFSSWQGTLEGWRPQYVPYYLRLLLRLLES